MLLIGFRGASGIRFSASLTADFGFFWGTYVWGCLVYKPGVARQSDIVFHTQYAYLKKI